MTTYNDSQQTGALRALGIMQIVAAVLGGGEALFLVPGYGMCTDGFSESYCNGIGAAIAELGLLALTAFVCGIVSTAAAPDVNGRAYKFLVIAGFVLLLLLVARGGSLWALASTPVYA